MSTQEPLRQVGVDTHVEVELIDQDGHTEQMAFDLVYAAAADFDRGLLGVNTPFGSGDPRQICGQRSGVQ